jgi:hypothetical protein
MSLEILPNETNNVVKFPDRSFLRESSRIALNLIRFFGLRFLLECVGVLFKEERLYGVINNII